MPKYVISYEIEAESINVADHIAEAVSNSIEEPIKSVVPAELVGFNAAETAIILASLRRWQQDPLVSFYDFFEDVPVPDAEAIDALCERINFGEV